jgi:hypothetical protein
MQLAGLVYLAGVILGLWRTDAPAGTRIVLALFWPIGPLAFAVTISVLLAASLVAFPLFGGALAIGGVVLWWLLGG